jgi:hypothetical protein
MTLTSRARRTGLVDDDRVAGRGHLREKGVTLAQKMQVGPCIPRGIQL